MDSRRKVRKPHMQSSSSSDDSSSSSSDSDDRRKKKYRAGRKQRDSSSESSSEGEMKRKSHKHQHKKASRKHSHSSKMRTKMLAANAKKELRSISPTSRASHKHHLKEKLVKKPKAIDEHERHPTRREELVEHRIASPTTRIRVSIPNNRAIQERSRRKESPASRRHVREASDDHMRGHYHKEKMGRFQEEEEHYKYIPKGEGDRMPRAQITPERHHHQHEHRSQSHGRMPKREEYEMMRGEPRRPPENIPPERPSYDYNDERRMPDYNEGPTRMYEERGRRPIEPHPRARGFEGSSNWESTHPHEKKRPIYESSYNPKWSKEKGIPEWKQGESWKLNKMAPTMSHPPRRWQGPGDSWRSPHPSKIDSPGFKPRGSPYFGQKRFPFKRFPSQYSKINFPSQRVLPSASETSSLPDESKEVVKSSSPSTETLESGEIPSVPMEEEKMSQQPDTTFSGNVEAAEECEEGNLSEFSDVDDDDILNREEIDESHSSRKDKSQLSKRSQLTASSRVQSRLFHSLARKSALQQSQEVSTEQEPQDESTQKIISKIHANEELKKEMDLDFEEISDGELEEESRIRGLGDALGVDWASLIKETQKPTIKTNELDEDTKSRWSAHRILWDIGISAKFAGENFARETMTKARDMLRKEKEEWIKQRQNGENETAENEVAETFEQEAFELDNEILPHPLANVQIMMRKLAIERQNLISHSSLQGGRALSAGKDLEIRRKLCNLPAKDLHLDRSKGPNNIERSKYAEKIYQRLIGASSN